VRRIVPFAIACCLASGQIASEANRQYRDREFREKLAKGLASPSRDERQKPKELVAALKIEPGMTIADVGTGGGYMLPHLSAAVGEQGVVYAEDLFPDLIAAAKKHASQLTNVRYVQGTAKSAELPPGTMDLILVLDAYHHFDYPEAMMQSLRAALKPGGRIAIVEYHKNEKSMANGRALTHIRATREEFVREIEGFGFDAVDVKDFLPEVQWLGIFRPR
jgi:ubiquinone/menaquinone biosynthesis C-methylase UbiE